MTTFDLTNLNEILITYMKMKELKLLPYEVWKSVVGYEDYYEVSNFGRVKSLERVDCRGRLQEERILKPAKNRGGYLYITFSKIRKQRSLMIHRLVAEVFIENPDNLPQVNHKDENKENNRVENLEWMTAKKNANYGTRNERMTKAKSKPVYQYTLDGEFVKEWPSANEVQRQTGWWQPIISSCCRGKKKSAYGYIWKYKQSI